jgi:hypothetical protein
MHTSILLLILVNLFSILVNRNGKQLLQNPSVFIVWLLVFHACHDSCFLFVGAIKMFADVIACFALKCWPEFLREEFFVCKELVMAK